MRKTPEMTTFNHLQALLRWAYRSKKTGRYPVGDVTVDPDGADGYHTPQLHKAFVDYYQQGFHDPLRDASTLSERLWGSYQSNPSVSDRYEAVYIDADGNEIPAEAVTRLLHVVAAEPLRLRWARFFTLADWEWRLAAFPFDFIATFPCHHSECRDTSPGASPRGWPGHHTLAVRVWPWATHPEWEWRRKMLERQHGELYRADEWDTPSPALFGDGPDNTYWVMCHGAGGGSESIAQGWVKNADELWDKTASEAAIEVSWSEP